MAYHGVELQNSITIGKIFSIHYFEYMSNFSFAGESHNFWEFICVDKGEVGVTRGKSYTILKKGDTIRVTVSKGALVTIPDVAGKKKAKAKETITKA